MTENQSNTSIYRLATPQEWEQTQITGYAPLRDIDVKDGYLHLSTRDQVLETANLYFADVPSVLVMEIPAAPLGDALKYELAPKRGELFPHLYARLEKDKVSQVITLVRGENGYEFGDPV